MAEPTLPAALTLAAVTKLVENVVDELCRPASAAIASRLKEWTTRVPPKKIAQHLIALRQVKTIWQIDRSVDLLDFYYPAKVLVTQSTPPIAVDHISDLPRSRAILIEGKIGQGKSVFLRYLCSRQTTDRGHIPLFIELRKVRPEASLPALVAAAFKGLGLCADEEMLSYLLSSGRVMLFLDAFDEVADNLQASTVFAIEQLLSDHPALTVIVTSRPDGQVARLPPVRVCRLAPIAESDVVPLLAKLVDDRESYDVMIRALAHHKTQGGTVHAVLDTPLMVTLLAITFKASHSIPENISSFYDSIFATLITRHDNTKPGIVRPRRSTLADSRMHEVFSLTCYICKRRGWLEGSKREILDAVAAALDRSGSTCAPDDFLHDIVTITSLLIREGDTYRFVHKSIREFFTADYIRSLRDESQAAKIYGQLQSKWSSWIAELSFLKEIDEYRYAKFFAVPHLSREAARLEDAGTALVEAVYGDLTYQIIGDPKSWATYDGPYRPESTLSPNEERHIQRHAIVSRYNEEVLDIFFHAKDADAEHELWCTLRRPNYERLDTGILDADLALAEIPVLPVIRASHKLLHRLRLCADQYRDRVRKQLASFVATVRRVENNADLLDI